MKKKYLLIVVLIALILSVVITGCAKDEGATPTPTPQNTTEPQSYDDDDYTIEIVGIGEETIKVTKGQIREIAREGKEVVFTEDEPAYASDKTDDDGNKIPHTVKGVYLDDILAAYGNGAKTSDFSSMSIYADDGYETILSEDVFNTDKGGVKMIVAYEYDGVVLNPEEKSGALRAIFPDKPANTWAKQLAKIVFTKDEGAEAIPVTESVYFTESTGEKYDGSYELDGTTYYGFSFKKAFSDGILTSKDESQMFVYAWDGSEYTSYKTKEYFEDAFLVFALKSEESDEFEADKDAPVFNGVNIKKGMKVKSTMYATVDNSTIAILDVLFTKLDEGKKGSILLSDLIKEINMKEANTYVITGVDGTEVVLAKEDLAGKSIKSTDEGYVVSVEGKGGDQNLVILSIKVK